MGAFYHMTFFSFNRKRLHALLDYMSEKFRYSSETGVDEKTMEGYIAMTSKVLLLWSTTLLFGFAVALWPLVVKGR